jgi:hypothetical protein
VKRKEWEQLKDKEMGAMGKDMGTNGMGKEMLQNHV